MSDPELPPPAKPLTFEVWWKDQDLPHSTYSGITGSTFEDGVRLVLMSSEQTFIVNFDHCLAVSVSDDE